MSETITQSSVRCSVSARLAIGDAETPSGSGSSPMAMPSRSRTIGAEIACRWSRFGMTTAVSSATPKSR